MIQVGDEILIVETRYDSHIETVNVPSFRDLHSHEEDVGMYLPMREFELDVQNYKLSQTDELLEGVRIKHFRREET